MKLTFNFYASTSIGVLPRDVYATQMHSAVYGMVLCLSVCLSVRSRYLIDTAECFEHIDHFRHCVILEYLQKQVCRSSLLSGRSVRWSHAGESR